MEHNHHEESATDVTAGQPALSDAAGATLSVAGGQASMASGTQAAAVVGKPRERWAAQIGLVDDDSAAGRTSDMLILTVGVQQEYGMHAAQATVSIVQPARKARRRAS